MAEHADDGRVLAVDKRTGKKYREHPHIVKMAKHLELAPSTKGKTTKQVNEPERPSTGAAKNQEK